jgi:iron complex outermembrane receptor protein
MSRARVSASVLRFAGLVTALAAGANVFAAEADNSALHEIIVTAQKREQPLQDVPTTVTVLTASELRSANVYEVDQISLVTPGILINSDQTGRNTDIKIRGIGNDEGSNLRPSIGFFYNDIPLLIQKQGGQSTVSDLDLGDLKRVEILKGPQSTLFGESVSGGAIDFHTQRPAISDGLNGRASVTAGNLDLTEARAAVGAPFGDKFAVRVSAYDNRVEDQVVNTVDGSRRKLRSDGYALQLLFQPLERLSFIVEYNRRETQTHHGTNDGEDVLAYGPQTIAQAAAAGITLTPADPYDREAQMVYPLEETMVNTLTSLHASWTINDRWSLASITGYQTNTDHFFGTGLLGGYNVSGTVVPLFWAFGWQKINYTTEELRLNFSGEHLDSMIGAFFSHYYAPVSQDDLGYVFPSFVFPLLTYQTDDNNQWSVFTHNSYKFNPDWEVVAGYRYTKEDDEGYRELVPNQGAYSGLPLDTSSFTLRKDNEHDWGGTLKLLRHFGEAVTLYGGVDRGFRLGGINTLGAPNYADEIAWNYEVGLKGLFLQNTLRMNLSAYIAHYDGYQAVVFDSANFTFITQNADASTRGVELETEWAPSRQLTLSADIAYNDAHYDHYLGAQCDNYQVATGLCPNNPGPLAQDLSGRRLSQAPLWSANGVAQYGDALRNTGLNWFVRGEYVFRDSAYAHAVGEFGDPLQLMPSYGLFNASVGLSGAGWQVSLWGKNLTNKNYLTQVIRQPTGSDPDYVLARIGMERTYGVTASYSF